MDVPLLKSKSPVDAQLMSSDRAPKAPNLQPMSIAFIPWFGVQELPECSYDIGSISYGVTGAFKIELLAPNAAKKVELSFETPLAIRITQEGSLMEYWNSGFEVHGHNVFIAARSQLLDWFEHSSSGVHSVDRVKHFAIFTDDVCVEVLSTDDPIVLICK